MRRFLLPLLFVFLALSCQKQPGAPEISLSQEVLSLDSAAGSGTVELTVNRPWTATTDVPWCKVIPASGNGFDGLPGDLHIVCEENPDHAERSCTVTIKSGALTKTLTVKQNHKEGVLIPENDFELGPEERTFSIDLWYTTPYTVETDGQSSDWISIVRTKSMTGGALTIHLTENTSVARTGQINVSYNGHEDIIRIRQSCGYVKFEDDLFKSACMVYDENQDGRLSVDEARKATMLYIEPETKSVAGLEQFVNLSTLYCTYAALETLDITPLTALEYLLVNGRLKNLLCHGLPQLKELILRETAISSLDLTGCDGLTTLDVNDDTRLTDVRFGNHPKLASLSFLFCPFASDFSLISFPSLKEVHLESLNQTKHLTISDLPKLERLDITSNPVLSDLEVTECPSLQVFWLSQNGIKKLSLPGFYGLKEFGGDFSGVEEFSIGLCPKLEYFSCDHSSLQELELSFCPNLLYLECNFAQTEKLDLSPCPHLLSVSARDGRIKSLIAKDNPELQTLFANDNQLEVLDLQGCRSLVSLSVERNNLSSVNITGADALYSLYLNHNPITSLDCSLWPNLYELACEMTRLTTLDMTHNPELQFLYAMNNPDLKAIYLIAGKDYWQVQYDPVYTTLYYL